jgi:hypothetical protein
MAMEKGTRKGVTESETGHVGAAAGLVLNDLLSTEDQKYQTRRRMVGHVGASASRSQ